MNITLHDKYKGIKFNDDVVTMFTEILEQDQSMTKVFHYIAKEETRQSKENDGKLSGVTINDIIENVSLVRLTRHGKGKNYKYEPTTANITRKTAERIVDKLLCLSLIYFKPVNPYKVLYLTNRGKQILVKILELKSKSKELEK